MTPTSGSVPVGPVVLFSLCPAARCFDIEDPPSPRALLDRWPSPQYVVPAVDIERLSRHGGRIGTREEDAGCANFLNGNQAADRGTTGDALHQLVEVRDPGGRSGGERARADSVHPDPLWTELGGHVAHGRFQCRLYGAHDAIVFNDLVRA